MTFAIAGVSGNTGAVVADTLLSRGQHVRVIVRDAAKGKPWADRGAEVAVANLDDAAALTRALQGAAGAYLLIPPNYAAADFRAYQDNIARTFAAAARESKVPHVVLLSSVGAQHAAGTGPIAGLHYAERQLATVPSLVVSSVRAGYFYDNEAAAAASAKQSGTYPTFFPADHPIAMVSTGDIGRLAATLLLEGGKASEVIELGTSHTVGEIAKVLEGLLGKPVQVQTAPRGAVQGALEGAGLSADMAALYTEMTYGVLDDRVVFEGKRHVASAEPLDAVFRRLLG